MWGFIQLILRFLGGGLQSVFGIGGAKAAPPKPSDVVSEQAQQTPALAATAARDEQALADQTAQVTAERTSNANASQVAAAVGDAERRSVQESSADLQHDPDLPFRN